MHKGYSWILCYLRNLLQRLYSFQKYIQEQMKEVQEVLRLRKYKFILKVNFSEEINILSTNWRRSYCWKNHIHCERDVDTVALDI